MNGRISSSAQSPVQQANLTHATADDSRLTKSQTAEPTSARTTLLTAKMNSAATSENLAQAQPQDALSGIELTYSEIGQLTDRSIQLLLAAYKLAQVFPHPPASEADRRYTTEFFFAQLIHPRLKRVFIHKIEADEWGDMFRTGGIIRAELHGSEEEEQDDQFQYLHGASYKCSLSTIQQREPEILGLIETLLTCHAEYFKLHNEIAQRKPSNALERATQLIATAQSSQQAITVCLQAQETYDLATFRGKMKASDEDKLKSSRYQQAQRLAQPVASGLNPGNTVYYISNPTIGKPIRKPATVINNSTGIENMVEIVKLDEKTRRPTTEKRIVPVEKLSFDPNAPC